MQNISVWTCNDFIPKVVSDHTFAIKVLRPHPPLKRLHKSLPRGGLAKPNYGLPLYTNQTLSTRGRLQMIRRWVLIGHQRTMEIDQNTVIVCWHYGFSRPNGAKIFKANSFGKNHIHHKAFVLVRRWCPLCNKKTLAAAMCHVVNRTEIARHGTVEIHHPWSRGPKSIYQLEVARKR